MVGRHARAERPVGRDRDLCLPELRRSAHAERVLTVAVPVADEDAVGRAPVADDDVGVPGRDRVAEEVGEAAAHPEGVSAVAVPVADEDLVPCPTVRGGSVGRSVAGRGAEEERVAAAHGDVVAPVAVPVADKDVVRGAAEGQ
jgi:hypothetical protein